MSATNAKLRIFLIALLGLSFAVAAPVLQAQEQTGQAGGGQQAGSGGKNKKAGKRAPHPAAIEPRAPRTLLLDVVDTGPRFIAVGESGHILRSRDGHNWQQIPSPSRAALTAVDFSDSRHGWAVGWDTVILHTSDGGKTWRLQHFKPALQKPLLDVLAMSKQKGFAVGAYGLFLVTRDTGKNWKPVKTKFDSKNQWHLNSITRLHNGQLLIAGEKGTLGYSSDGGRTWKPLKSPYPGSFYDAAPIGQRGALIAGLLGHVYCTPALGKPWKRLKTGTQATFMGASRLRDGDILLTGQNGAVLKVRGNACNPQGSVTTPANSVDSYLSKGTLGRDGALIVVGENGLKNLRQTSKQ